MAEHKRVVVIHASRSEGGRGALPSEASPLRDYLTRHPGSVVKIISVTSLGPSAADTVQLSDDTEPVLDKVLHAVGVTALSRRMQTSPLGRLLVSLGPLHPGRATWRKVRKSTRALSLLKGSDAVFAADLASVTTAWRALRRGWVAEAHVDTRAMGEMRRYLDR